MDSKNVKIVLLPICFLGFLLLHVIDSWLQWLPEPNVSDARVKVEKPELDLDFLDPFPRDYEAYYNENFNWRNYFIKLSSYLNYYTFKKSSLPDQVLTGEEGWLYKSGFQLDMYRGKFLFTGKELKDITEELKRRRDIVRENGGTYYLVIAPLKHHIYPEFLPDKVTKINAMGCREQLVNYLNKNTDLKVLDLTPTILEHKSGMDTILFYRTDHHWTPHTALLAAQAIINHLKVDFPALPSIDRSNYSLSFGSLDGLALSQMLGMSKEIREFNYPILRHKVILPVDSIKQYTPPHDFPFPREYALANSSGLADLPSLFMVRESFANNLVDLLGPHFERSFFLFDNWKHQFNEDIYQSEGGDIYVQMVWEGLLFNLMKNPPEDARW